MLTAKLLLAVVIWWISSPVASHLIARLEVTTNPDLKREMAVRSEEDPQEEAEL